jgi:hypothetical protein
MSDSPSESQQMFRALMRAFLAHLPRSAWRDIRRLVILAWAVVGLCLTKKVTFAGWGEYLDSPATQAASRTRRFARWFGNAQIQVQAFYAPLVRAALSDWAPTERLYLALDASIIKGSPFVLVRLSLIYRGRAIPLTWRVLCHASASVAFADYAPVLEQALADLPSGLPIVLLADRGFVHAEWFQWLQRHQWHYRIRLTGDTLIHLPNRQVVPVGRLCPPKGTAHFYHGVGLLGVGLRPCHLALAQLDEPNQDPWYLVSDEPTALQTLEEYGLRFDLEENFLDDKSNGFQVESSRLETPEALERLFLVLAVATLHFTCVGVGVVRRKLRRWVDTHWDRGMSYLKMGWSWVRQQYRRHWPQMPAFWLNPAPDPEPAIASRRQAARPKPTWVIAFKT